MRTLLVALLLLTSPLLSGCSPEAEAPVPFKSGERIIFFGDSITQAGVQPGGYVTLIAEHLAATYPDLGIEVIGAGISGHKVPDLLARMQHDVLDLNPTVVVIYIGINDVWHWFKFEPVGTERAVYESGLHTMVRTLTTAGIRVLLCTPSVIGEKTDGTNETDEMLDDYAEISRSVAATESVPVCDLHAAFQTYLTVNNPEQQTEGILTIDGVHLNAAGNQFVADRILEALSR